MRREELLRAAHRIGLVSFRTSRWARLAGVSETTLRNYLTDARPVSASMRMRIEAVLTAKPGRV